MDKIRQSTHWRGDRIARDVNAQLATRVGTLVVDMFDGRTKKLVWQVSPKAGQLDELHI